VLRISDAFHKNPLPHRTGAKRGESATAIFGELRKAEVGLRRIHLPRTSVNRGQPNASAGTGSLPPGKGGEGDASPTPPRQSTGHSERRCARALFASQADLPLTIEHDTLSNRSVSPRSRPIILGWQSFQPKAEARDCFEPRASLPRSLRLGESRSYRRLHSRSP
jgi:hypothetical protein